MALPPRKIGNAFVNPLGFGTMGLSLAYGAVESDEERFKVLDAVLESATKSGFLASKFGFTPDHSIRGDAAHVKEACNRSLSRFGVDYIDLYYQHRVDSKVPIEPSVSMYTIYYLETVGATAKLVKEGKVRYLGLSECTANGLRRAHAIHPISALQVEYSPLVLEIESPKVGLLKTARDQIKSPDQFEESDFRRTIPKYFAENFPKILSVVDRLGDIGKKHDATPGQVTLAWILAQGDDIIVIPGTKKIKYVKENMGATKVDEDSQIRKLAEEADAIPGSRYPEGAFEIVYVESPPFTGTV
ncbi:hypothetical protein PM082_020680 [Marasmius tenuissimus]|nr:hypothetical protein PM082_020680 [Marasmius tenuissimus]